MNSFRVVMLPSRRHGRSRCSHGASPSLLWAVFALGSAVYKTHTTYIRALCAALFTAEELRSHPPGPSAVPRREARVRSRAVCAGRTPRGLRPGRAGQGGGL